MNPVWKKIVNKKFNSRIDRLGVLTTTNYLKTAKFPRDYREARDRATRASNPVCKLFGDVCEIIPLLLDREELAVAEYLKKKLIIMHNAISTLYVSRFARRTHTIGIYPSRVWLDEEELKRLEETWDQARREILEIISEEVDHGTG